ncbi:MAG TPA: HAMP domain-containing sensor histidine kinase, partial [Oligoflexia bacterium]|nr:HAMP domain-containing sensor histidine kinase [Oligoflexia bacterium]
MFMSAAEVISAAGLVLAFAAVMRAARRKLACERELNVLLNQTRCLCRGAALPQSGRFGLRAAESLWRLILLLAARGREIEQTKEIYNEAIKLGSKLAGACGDLPVLAQAFAELVLRQATPEALCAAVILRSAESGELEVAASAGLPQRRIENVLLVAVQSLIDECDAGGEGNWGYQFLDNQEYCSLQALGVGLTLIVPLLQDASIAGCLWLGLGSAPLPAARRGFLSAFAAYAAASFSAARKSKERVEQSGRERDFLLGLSHDLRAPGNAALYAVRELLCGDLGPLSDEQRTQIEFLERSINSQLSLIGDVLDFSRHQHGLLRAQPKRIELGRIVAESAAQYRPLAEEKDLVLRVECGGSAAVDVDPRHLQRIIANLLGNAVKYTDKGEIELSTKAECGEAVISVADTGIG